MGKRKQEEVEAPGIVVLYTSLMILLLAFFILLNSISKTEEGKVQAVYQSLMGSFGFQPGGMSPLSSDMPNTSIRVTAPMDPMAQDWDSLRGLVLKDKIGDQVRLLVSGSAHTAVMPDMLLFKPGSDKLSQEGKVFLAQVAAVIESSQYPITINGHTDDAPAMRPDGKDNFAVSANRALAVLRFLEGQGVDPLRMAAFGLAGYQPLVSNNSLVHRRQNNRVDLVFDAKDITRHHLPESGPKQQLDFKGFVFDLLDVPINQDQGDREAEDEDGAR